MPKPRSSQVSLNDTAYYHCVRRTFLCATVAALLTSILVRGTRYAHRRAWVEDKVLWLSSIFAIGICAYAVMSNHVHLMLCVDKDKAMSCIQTSHYFKFFIMFVLFRRISKYKSPYSMKLSTAPCGDT
ncbi:MAG: hypothetical protein ACJAV1_001246 [Paraglaciecola sp.]|jgi:hypothetical protein